MRSYDIDLDTDTINLPQVGDAVSYAFNGDIYPDGTIVSITEGTMRVIKTDTGNTYYRKSGTTCWKRDRTWSLIKGHTSERNRHF
tara:strand:+ start:268 stop:522 length:255 start_codon:yes stop_codon:yes gene_type:complete